VAGFTGISVRIDRKNRLQHNHVRKAQKMELRHLRYLSAVAECGTIREASRRLHVSQSAISEQIADLEHELGGVLLDRGQRGTRLTPQGEIFLEEARKTLASADRAVDLARRSLLGQEGSLAIGFFLWGVGGFFASLVRDFRKLYPQVKLTLVEMHTSVQMEALESGKIDVGFTRPLEPPHDRILRSELLWNDPFVAVLTHDHPLAPGPVRIEDLARERFVTSDRSTNPSLFDSIVALCSRAGFSPNLVNSSATWSGVLTLVESGEGIALVPSGVRYLRTPGIVFAEVLPETAHVGLSISWDPRNEGPVVRNFLRLVRADKERIRSNA
jgi:DNA-binding transcriptional LysR family regulator